MLLLVMDYLHIVECSTHFTGLLLLQLCLKLVNMQQSILRGEFLLRLNDRCPNTDDVISVIHLAMLD
jgi:hypothetical protein